MLVIDDDDIDQDMLKHSLKKSGLYKHILTAKDGKEAIELFENYQKLTQADAELFPPLIIFLDINMPRMDGFEFLEEISKRTTIKPFNKLNTVIMLTSSENEKDINQAKKFQQVKDYIMKPLSVNKAKEIAALYAT